MGVMGVAVVIGPVSNLLVLDLISTKSLVDLGL